MQLHTTQLQWTRQAGLEQLQGQAELQMLQLSTRLSTLRPLGSYRGRVQGGDTVALTLDTLEGSLLLQGTGQILNGRCLLYTSDAADDMQCVDLGGRRIIKKIFFSSRRRHTRY